MFETMHHSENHRSPIEPILCHAGYQQTRESECWVLSFQMNVKCRQTFREASVRNYRDGNHQQVRQNTNTRLGVLSWNVAEYT